MKTYILDTNVLLHDPRSIFKFDDNLVVLPLPVIEEVDKFKKDLNEIGRNAREISRYLDALRDSESASLSEGVPINDGRGFLKVALIDDKIVDRLPPFMNRNADNLILSVALHFAKDDKNGDVIFVSKDINLRIRADAMGVQSKDYFDKSYGIAELHTGMRTLDVSDQEVGEFYRNHQLRIQEPLLPNEFVILKGPSTSALALHSDKEAQTLLPLNEKSAGNVYGIHARNKEQRFALELLLNDKVKLVCLMGTSGTGKTLLALAAGMQKTVEERVYRRLLVSRPIFPMGKDIGFLPGDINEKLRPWMQPIFDNLELLTAKMPVNKNDDGFSGHKDVERRVDDLVALGLIEIEPLTYIRGRSIPNQYIIVDEAQNLTPHEIKTIITRAGEDTKIVLTGDIYQIDNPYIDVMSNGLAYVVEHLKQSPLAGSILFSKGERSELANLAAENL